jgi:acetyl-CoA carboxylase carboxyltransferase component
MSGEERIEELRQKKKAARQSGGPERIAARLRQGAGSARERVERLLDPDTFVELDVFVEGAVTGHGKVAGRDVYVFSQDAEVPQSSLGEESSRKLVKVMDLALNNGAPLVGIYDAGVDEGMTTLGAYSGLFLRNVMASGVVPQLAAVVGPVAGAAAYSAALADFVVMVKGTSHLLLGDPGAARVAGANGAGLEGLAGARALSEQGGVAHMVADDEGKCLDTVRELLSYMPQNNLEDAPLSDGSDPVDRMDQELEALAGAEAAQDVREVIGRVVDEGSFLELLPLWGKSLVVGFARLGGRSVGVVANQAIELDGRLDLDASAKGARFVRFCDAFSLPVVTFVDTPGFVSGEEQGQGRMLREAAKLMYAFAEATVPKLSVVIGRAFAEGFEIMCSKHIKADFCFAWPTARISAAPAGAAADAGCDSPYEAAQAGHLDDIIEPVTTRPRLVAALEACASKRESRPAKKHGNIPL